MLNHEYAYMNYDKPSTFYVTYSNICNTLKYSKSEFISILQQFYDVNEYVSNIVKLKFEIKENNKF